MFHDDPGRTSIDDRLEEPASMLSAGFLRLKRCTGCILLAASSGDKPV